MDGGGVLEATRGHGKLDYMYGTKIIYISRLNNITRRGASFASIAKTMPPLF